MRAPMPCMRTSERGQHGGIQHCTIQHLQASKAALLRAQQEIVAGVEGGPATELVPVIGGLVVLVELALLRLP
jgi:hypothetical protein